MSAKPLDLILKINLNLILNRGIKKLADFSEEFIVN
jgi:hypothetical protein